MPVKDTDNGRVIILGLDGLSPDIIEPMMAEGKLPNFRRVKEMGSYSRLATTNPPQSPVAWSTFATGLNPGEHGLFDFIRRRPGTYLPDISLTRLENGHARAVREGKAFWQSCSEAGVPCVILGCPVTFPPEKISGKMLSGMGVPDLLGTEGTFAFYTTEPQTVTGDTGGEVHVVAPANPLKLELLGPQQQGLTGKAERMAIPFTLRVSSDKSAATVSLPQGEFTLHPGAWSPWQAVTFKVGAFRRMHGVTRFHLAASEPYVKLYVSPICLDPRDPWFPISFPKDYSRQLADELGMFSTRGMPFDTWALNEGRISDDAFIAHAEELLQERTRLLQHELVRCKRGVFFCYFEYPDIIQHMYWRFIDKDHALYDPNAPERLKNMISQCYVKMDAIVGIALAELRPEDTLIVLSDHGFTSFRRALHLNSWLRANGYLVLRDSTVGVGGPLFQDVDWSRTRAYALGFGGIYLNLRGREPEGIVAPGAVAESLATEIQKGLAAWTDPKTGLPVIHRVYRQDGMFTGPHKAEAPDLYIGTARGYRTSWQTALGAAPQAQMEDNAKKWSGDHLVDPELVPGILFATRSIAGPKAAMADLAPAIIRLSGVR